MRQNWFKITNQAGVGEISIRGIVGISNKSGEDWFGSYEGEGGTVREFEEELRALDGVSVINLYISSEGGYVAAGLAIHDMLARHSARVVAHIDGYAFSIATVIAMAADEIRMPSNALLMIHNAAGPAYGDYRVMEQAVASLKAHNQAIIRAYTGKSGQTADVLQPLMDATTYLDGAAAKALGLADVVTDEVALSACVIDPRMVACLNMERVPEKYRGRFDILSNSTASVEPTITNSNIMDTQTPPSAPTQQAAAVEINLQDEATRQALVTALQPVIAEAVNAATASLLERLAAAEGAVAAAATEVANLRTAAGNGMLSAAASGTATAAAVVSANGNKNEKTRDEFAALSPREKSEFIKAKGKLID